MVYSRETLIKRFKICFILGIVSAVALVGINIYAAIEGGFTMMIAITLAACLVASLVVFPIEFLGFTINGTFKKSLIGMIAPIPVISGCIECFKALYYGIRAIIVIAHYKTILLFDDNDDSSDAIV